jgi:hypothetical protein
MRWFVIFWLLCCATWAQTPPTPTVLVVGDVNQIEVTRLESQLRQLLREQRDAGKLKARLVAYNLALPEHRRSAKILGLEGKSLPLLAVCSVDAKGLPRKVEWLLPVTNSQQALAQLYDYLGEESPEPVLSTPASLRLSEPTIQVGGQTGVINVKVRMVNPTPTTLAGPLRVVLQTQLPGQPWQAAGEQSIDKVPGGWNLTKDFFLTDGALFTSPFTVKAQVFQGETSLGEATSSYQPPQ